MDTGLIVELAALALFVGALLALHELAHVVVARAHGYPLVCFGLSPLAVAVVFLDQPIWPYWVLQVVVPMVVSAAATYLGLFALPVTSSAALVIFPGDLTWQIGFCLLLSALTSAGDLACMAMELRRPLWGRERVLRDVRVLKRIRSLIRFTSFGRRYLAEEFGLSPGEFLKGVSFGRQ